MSWELSEESGFYLLWKKGMESFKMYSIIANLSWFFEEKKRATFLSPLKKRKISMEFGGSSPCYRRNISFLSQKSSQSLSLTKKNPSARSASFVFYLWKIRKFFDSSSHLNLKFFRRLVHKEDQELIEVINNCVAQSFLYFSPEFDLTQNEQSRVHGKFASSTFSLHSFNLPLGDND